MFTDIILGRTEKLKRTVKPGSPQAPIATTDEFVLEENVGLIGTERKSCAELLDIVEKIPNLCSLKLKWEKLESSRSIRASTDDYEFIVKQGQRANERLKRPKWNPDGGIDQPWMQSQ